MKETQLKVSALQRKLIKKNVERPVSHPPPCLFGLKTENIRYCNNGATWHGLPLLATCISMFSQLPIYIQDYYHDYGSKVLIHPCIR